jgi:hypothetical protein
VSSGRQVRLPRVMVITDDREWAVVRSEQVELEHVSVLPPADFAAADLVLVIGPIGNAERALELAGSVRLALERGATFVFLYGGTFANVDWRFISDLVPEIAGGSVSGSVRAAATDPAPHPAFRDYIMLHGQTDLQFSSLPDGAEVLAYVLTSLQPQRQVSPTAVRIGFADGNLYIVPYQPPSSHQLMLERLAQAVIEHREGRLVAVPPFFEELRLPGEEKIVQGIVAAQRELERLEDQRAALTKHKHLVGHFAGVQLDKLVIEEMNLVLSGTEVQARDVEERYVEDFELVDAAGTRKALAESKGVGGGITLTHVNQVNNHRSEGFDAGADELPGLLVVNAFRNDDTLDRRRESVHERIVRHARRMNVLVLRTWDLYQLVVRHLAGHDDGAEILGALVSGGGWLEVEETGLTTHTE